MPEQTGPPRSDKPDRKRPPRRGRRGRGGAPGGGRNGDAPGPARKPDGGVVIVQFKGHRKACYHNDHDVELRVGDYCLVEADRGRDLGRVCYVGEGSPQWWREAGRQGVLARADAQQLQRLHENRADEWDDYDICLEKIQKRNLSMQLVSVERQFDRNKITFFFTAEKRVDFRQLVKDLAAIFRTRIELRQIGVRDEAKMKGGLGVCGRELCCSTFMHGFNPVTLKMAKAQQLPLSPNKLSGLCGRLRCCLAYEHKGYAEVQKRMPRVGTPVEVDGSRGRVRKIDLLRETATVMLEDSGDHVVRPVTDLSWDTDRDLPRPRAKGGSKGCCKGKH